MRDHISWNIFVKHYVGTMNHLLISPFQCWKHHLNQITVKWWCPLLRWKIRKFQLMNGLRCYQHWLGYMHHWFVFGFWPLVKHLPTSLEYILLTFLKCIPVIMVELYWILLDRVLDICWLCDVNIVTSVWNDYIVWYDNCMVPYYRWSYFLQGGIGNKFIENLSFSILGSIHIYYCTMYLHS